MRFYASDCGKLIKLEFSTKNEGDDGKNNVCVTNEHGKVRSSADFY